MGTLSRPVSLCSRTASLSTSPASRLKGQQTFPKATLASSHTQTNPRGWPEPRRADSQRGNNISQAATTGVSVVGKFPQN